MTAPPAEDTPTGAGTDVAVTEMAAAAAAARAARIAHRLAARDAYRDALVAAGRPGWTKERWTELLALRAAATSVPPKPRKAG